MIKLENSSILIRGEGGEADWAMIGLENTSNPNHLGGGGGGRQSHHIARKFLEFEEFEGRGWDSKAEP